MGREREKIRSTYICFNDEAGNWNNSKDFFYVRVSVIVNSLDIKGIEQNISKIQNKYGLENLYCELKWQDLWILRKHFKQNSTPKDYRLKQLFNFLKNKEVDYHLLIDYCSKILKLLNKYNITIIATFSLIQTNHKEQDIVKFHIQDHLQRIQMQFNNSTIFIIYDSIDERKQKLFKEIHKNLVINGDYVNYSSISETLLFDYSYDNKLLQLVDFIAGIIRNTFVSIAKNDTDNYKKAVEFFKNYVYPKLAKDRNENIWGVGLKETPRDDHYRKKIKESIEKIL